MGVFAIAQLRHAIAIDDEHIREHLLLVRKSKPLADHTVIGSRCRIGLCRAIAAEGIAGFTVAFLKLGNQVVIICRIGQDRHKGVVFRSAAHHRWPANVDILNDFIARCAFGHCLRKGVKVNNYQVDCADVMRGHRGGMFGIIAHRQQTAMHHRMQCLHASVHHFGKAC